MAPVHPHPCNLAECAVEIRQHTLVLKTITVIANGQPKPAPAGCPLPDFISTLRLAPDRVVVERNGAALTPTEARQTLLSDGDRLEIVRIVPGG